MPDNIGGLDYRITVSGNVDEAFDNLEARTKALSRQVQKLGDQTTRRGGTTSDKSRTVEFQKQAKAAKQASVNFEASSVAVAKNDKLMQDLQIKGERVVELSNRLGVSQQKAAQLIGVSSAQAERLKLNLFDAQQVARQFLFTFRRLVGILAIFTLARKLSQNLALAVTEISRFNSELETAEIGIASIVASVGQIRDSQGELVTGAEAFSTALAASSSILNQLKKDAIGSIATFEALVKSYQVAIGPGLAAGLDLDQVRVLSKRLAEGAISLGVPLNQLSEEIRSLLQGTATARNTRIAVLFGGAEEANEAIRNAKEQGNLYDVLIDKLQGVAQGADAASQSFAVLASNLQDSVQLLLAEGGIEYFDTLKEALLGITQAITTVDAGGAIVFRPEAVETVRTLAEGLSDVINNVREFTDSKSVFEGLTNSISILTSILSSALPLALELFRGISLGVSSVVVPVRILLADLKDLVGILKQTGLGRFFLSAAKYAVATVVALTLWRKILIQIGLLVGSKGLLGAIAKVQAAFIAATTESGKFNASVLFSNILTAILGKQMDAVAVKAALASGGLTILLGILAYVVARMTILKDQTSDFSDLVTDSSDNMDDLLGLISGSADAMDENVKSAEEWRDLIKDAVDELTRAQGLEGLSGDAKDFASNLVEAKLFLEDQTKEIRNQIKTRKEALSQLQREKEELQQILLARGQLQVSSRGEIFVAVGTEEASRLAEIKKEQAALEKVLADDTEKYNTIQSDTLKVLDLQTRAIQERVSQQSLVESQALDIAEAELKIAKSLGIGTNESIRDLATQSAKAQVLRAQVALAAKERDIAEQKLQANIKEAEALGESDGKQRILTALKAEQVRLSEENALAQAVELAQLKEAASELERQEKLLSGRFSDALSVGLQDFADELPALGEQIAETISGALEDLAGVVASTFKDAIDPRKDADLKTAFGEFFLDLAGQFVEAITAQLIRTSLVNLGLADDVGKDAALQTNTTAISTLTAQIQTLTTTIATQQGQQAGASTGGALLAGFSNAGGGGGATAANTEAAEQAGATIGAASKSDGRIFAIMIPLLIALLSQAFRKGGKVQPKGYASGGQIGGMARPSNIPASDTVPAWLTPGEFVMTKSAVQKYGTGVMNAINKGVLNPSSFSATGLAMGGMVRGIQHFANGGSVSKMAQTVASQNGTRNIYQPVMVASENSVDQLLTGGRKTFDSKVNKVDYIGDPNKSSNSNF